MNDRVSLHGLSIDRDLFALINDQALPHIGIAHEAFWSGFSDLISELTPKNRALLARREELETLINEWHAERRGIPHDPKSYRAFLSDIGYLAPEGPDFSVSTQGIDPEITAIPGPQLVVPVNNARYAINATNARWGSLYDALYGTDVISDEDSALTSGQYSEARGRRVVAFANRFLDETVPFDDAAYGDITGFVVEDQILKATCSNGKSALLSNAEHFVGYRGDTFNPTSILLKHHQLHIELVIDRAHPVGKKSASGVSDVLLESAITVIQDCEDSVAAVDGPDKTQVYANWLGLMRGTLSTIVSKGGETFERT
ncbi:MAG TPA: malate synthase G, partial [Gammaproteobacteria bacterium]|nr:malate synthase G [Gammaproteobacteria bacterium]